MTRIFLSIIPTPQELSLNLLAYQTQSRNACTNNNFFSLFLSGNQNPKIPTCRILSDTTSGKIFPSASPPTHISLNKQLPKGRVVEPIHNHHLEVAVNHIIEQVIPSTFY